jgi:hypothetical protein
MPTGNEPAMTACVAIDPEQNLIKHQFRASEKYQLSALSRAAYVK